MEACEAAHKIFPHIEVIVMKVKWDGELFCKKQTKSECKLELLALYPEPGLDILITV